jgi:diaminohydroxyphosphoribosylaminopyrimidine deaminase/5-amino-6-(5-phosphoribosylamino)uracil reductase
MQDNKAKHELYMKRCLQLAENGHGLVYPNPMVGSVVVHNDLIIGEGWHQKAGEAHAEVNAIKSVKDKKLLSEATIYVNLEPCSHYGRTPPCADLILEHKIKRVVIGSVDTNEKVGGKGIKRLKQHGVEVVYPIMEKECRDLNKRFYTFHEKNRPYVILKWAQSKDGYIFPELHKVTPGNPFWISNKYAQQRVHQYRAEEASILVGKNTVLQDDPKLNLRHFEGNDIMRLTIDKNLEIPDHMNFIDNSVKTIIYNDMKDEEHGETKYVRLNFSKELIGQIMDHLYAMDIQSLIVEGGAYTLSSFIKSGIWDEARVFESNENIHEGVKGPELKEKPISQEVLCDNTLFQYKNKK